MRRFAVHDPGTRRRRSPRPAGRAGGGAQVRARIRVRRHGGRRPRAARAAAPLDREDLGLLAVACYMLGRDDEYLAVREREHQAYLDAGEPLRAARVAFWIVMLLFIDGQIGRA